METLAGSGQTPNEGAPDMNDGGAARDMRIAYSGIGLMIIALVVASVLS